ncbi:response regulator transcription factor, partial [Streptomyces goshikiensis]
VSAEEPRTTVLLASESESCRNGLRSALEELSRYEVVDEVSTAAAAARKLGRDGHELVLMDTPLAREVGLCSKRLGGRLPCPPKIVLLVGGRYELLGEALDAGIRGFITPDPGAALLDAVLTHVLAGGCALFPEAIGDFAGTRREPRPRFPHARQRITTLTASERQVLVLLGHGLENARIAEAMHLSHTSVKTYVSRLLGKLHLDNRTQAALVANEAGLTPSFGLKPSS